MGAALKSPPKSFDLILWEVARDKHGRPQGLVL